MYMGSQERLKTKASKKLLHQTSFDAWRLNMNWHNVWQVNFDFLPDKPISVEPVQENISTDAGLLIFRQWGQKLGFTEGFSQQFDDRKCDPDHPTLEMVRSPVFGILVGYENQNDQDVLRSDVVFKLLANRLSDDDDLAS